MLDAKNVIFFSHMTNRKFWEKAYFEYILDMFILCIAGVLKNKKKQQPGKFSASLEGIAEGYTAISKCWYILTRVVLLCLDNQSSISE